jgi:hypothetical protein
MVPSFQLAICSGSRGTLNHGQTRTTVCLQASLGERLTFWPEDNHAVLVHHRRFFFSILDLTQRKFHIVYFCSGADAFF